MLDPVRAARVRRMVTDPDTWPGAELRMKRIVDDRIVAFGKIADPDDADGDRILLTRGGVIDRFESVEELIAAGWAVD